MSASVLHACESTLGGVGVFIAQLAETQRREGWRITVVAPDTGGVPARLRGIGVDFVPWTVRPDPGPWVLRETRGLYGAIHNARPAIVHLHSTKAGFAGRLLLRARLPTVFQPHSWGFFAVGGWRRAGTLGWERLGARWADAILCVSEEERLRGLEAGVNGRYAVLPNGVDLARFPVTGLGDRAQARRRLGLSDLPTVVCAGRLHRQKNQAMLLGAWPAVRAAVPDAQLLLLGDGPDRADLERQAAEGVRMIGQVADVRPWFAAADVVAQPSRWEGMSLSLLEARACGRSVVATDVPGMREVLVEGTGALVPLGRPDRLAHAIVERLSSPTLAEDEGRAARRHVEAHHDLRVQHSGVASLYDVVLARRPRDQPPRVPGP